ncbi:MAG: single-stranded DNA-binding protein [Planctomycetes bacterium]|nr:single-stranded DNA-binding protein [Planctomycetota bacterium]
MAGFNRGILIGNLTRDPELRYTPQGTAVADLRLAVTTVRGRSGSERKEETLFIDCTVWDRQAETCSEYLSKGRPVLVEGRLIEDQWQDKETGERRSRIKVYVQNVQFLGGRDGGSGASGRFDSGASGRFDAGASGRYDSGSSGESRRQQPQDKRESRGTQAQPRGGAADVFDDDLNSRGSGPAGDDIPF